MSFNPLIKSLIPDGGGGSVCELGNQTYTADRNFRSTEQFYRSRGYSSYTAIDLNDRYGSLVMDLNRPLDSTYDYRDQFDLVTNNGTGEHLFDQYHVFRNIHNLCKPNGRMIHVLPCLNWLNHGFFSFHPILFRDLAGANGYKLEKIDMANRDGHGVGPNWKELKNPNLSIVAILRKGPAETPFRAPIQGKYQGDVQSAEIREYYGL